MLDEGDFGSRERRGRRKSVRRMREKGGRKGRRERREEGRSLKLTRFPSDRGAGQPPAAAHGLPRMEAGIASPPRVVGVRFVSWFVAARAETTGTTYKVRMKACTTKRGERPLHRCARANAGVGAVV